MKPQQRNGISSLFLHIKLVGSRIDTTQKQQLTATVIEIARRAHLVWTKQYRVENQKFVNAKIVGINNTMIPQDQEDRYIQITKCEWDVLKAKRSQYDTTIAIKKVFQQYKINFSALRQKITLIAKSGMRRIGP
jgi:hypothetical protein